MDARLHGARIVRVAALAKITLFSLLVSSGASALAADPTLDQVYEAVHAGRLDQAQHMMAEVLRDHPNSAKAHYVEAEVLARQGRADDAQAQLNQAEQLAPNLPFASPTSVRQLRSLIAFASARESPIAGGDLSETVRPARGSSFPWGLLVIVLVGGSIVYVIVRARRNAAPVPYGRETSPSAPPLLPAPAGTPTSGAPSLYGAPAAAPPAGGLASNIVGSLATGAAVGAGVVAGEALAHELIDGHASDRDLPRNASSAPADSGAGDRDFGVSDAGSWDDSDSREEGGGDGWD